MSAATDQGPPPKIVGDVHDSTTIRRLRAQWEEWPASRPSRANQDERQRGPQILRTLMSEPSIEFFKARRRVRGVDVAGRSPRRDTEPLAFDLGGSANRINQAS